MKVCIGGVGEYDLCQRCLRTVAQWRGVQAQTGERARQGGGRRERRGQGEEGQGEEGQEGLGAGAGKGQGKEQRGEAGEGVGAEAVELAHGEARRGPAYPESRLGLVYVCRQQQSLMGSK